MPSTARQTLRKQDIAWISQHNNWVRTLVVSVNFSFSPGFSSGPAARDQHPAEVAIPQSPVLPDIQFDYLGAGGWIVPADSHHRRGLPSRPFMGSLAVFRTGRRHAGMGTAQFNREPAGTPAYTIKRIDPG